jgi:hypothetical protein
VAKEEAGAIGSGLEMTHERQWKALVGTHNRSGRMERFAPEPLGRPARSQALYQLRRPVMHVVI